MQIWLYFIGGAGGDSIANLLEQANNVEPVDGNRQWRLSHYIDNLACWWAPCFDREQCFRSSTPFAFNADSNAMTDRYKSLVEHSIPTVITSHDVTLNALNHSDHLEILTNKQIKVLIKHNDPAESFRLCRLKNFSTGSLTADANWCKNLQSLGDKFDHVLDIEQCHKDWIYVKQFCDKLAIDLNLSVYQQWQKLLQYQSSFLQHTVKSWRSVQSNGQILDFVPC